MVEFDGMEAWELIAILRRTNVSPQIRSKVIAIDTAFKSGGISDEDDRWLRRKCRDHRERISEMLEAEERARRSMVAESKGTSLGAIQRAFAEKERRDREAARLAERTKKTSTFGF